MEGKGSGKREALMISLDLVTTVPAEDTSVAELESALAAHIENMIEKDFNRLLHLLYRIDVSEEKLKTALAATAEPAGRIIADLIIERQLQKISFRKSYREGKGF